MADAGRALEAELGPAVLGNCDVIKVVLLALKPLSNDPTEANNTYNCSTTL